MVNPNKLELTSLQAQLLRILCIKSGVLLNQRQLAKLAHVSQPAVMKALPLLVKSDFITVVKDSETKRLSIALNTANNKVMQFKRVDNLHQLYESGFVDFLEKEYSGSTIILFGSYSRGEDTHKSDVDIAVIGRTKKNLNLTKFETEVGRTISVNFYDSFGKIHKHFKENLANGIILAGGFEL